MIAADVVEVAQDPGWFLYNAWIFPAVPFASFLLILFFGKRMKYKGAEFGIAALAIVFAAALAAGAQWISHVDDAGHGGHGTEEEHAVAAYDVGIGRSVAPAETTPAQLAAAADDGYASVAPVLREWRPDWWQSGGINFSVGTLVDGASVMMLFVVTFISLLVHVYSTDYVSGDVRYTHFFAFLSLFTASMLLLVIASNLIMFITAWELVGVCSFALIGHWWEEKKNSDAALKAFITNRVGDMGLLVGMIILFFVAGGGQTFSILEINTAAAGGGVSQTALLVASLCLIAAVMSKSGQFFLHTWLPDAMAGPTPVSALIHAATMVVAGVFMVARLYPVFFEGLSIAGSSINTLALVGGLTTLVGGGLAFVQRDIKKVLAYSTVSQLGYMVMALGVGAWTAAMFHLFTHAFFKACLFLGSGSVSHACHHSFDMKADMGGLRKYMPVTHATFLIGTLALAGAPFLSGFWSKDEILAGTGGFGFTDANGTYHLMLIMGLVTGGLTAAYMTRCYWLTFWGEYRGAGALSHEAVSHGQEDSPVAHGHDPVAHDERDPAEVAATDPHVPVTAGAVAPGHDAPGHDAHGHDAHGHDAHGHDAHGHGGLPHESGPRITIPLVVLAFMSFITAFANIPANFGFVPEGWRMRFEHYVEPVGAYFPALVHAEFNLLIAVASLVAAGLGAGLALAYYRKVYAQNPYATELTDGPTSRFALARAGYKVLDNRLYLDWLYTDVIVASTKGPLARAVNRFNQRVLDGVVDGVAIVARVVGRFTYDYVDQKVVDGVVNGSGSGASGTGGFLRRIQTGKVQQYAALMFAAAAVLAGVLVLAI